MISTMVYDVRGLGTELEVEFHGFSGGERNVKINLDDIDLKLRVGRTPLVEVVAHVRSSDDFMDLVLLTDALRGISWLRGSTYVLRLPYVPYARQDRAMNPGEAHGIRAFTTLLNSLNYDEVIIHDPHSDVTPALINNCEVVEQHKIITSNLHHSHFDVLVAPDAGAIKKTSKLAKLWGHTDIGVGHKSRDLKTGAITGTSYSGPSVEGKNVLIVDDIIDGGATFIALAKVLRKDNPKTLTLYATHGIFSKGGLALSCMFDEIVCSNIWSDNLEKADKKVIHGVIDIS